MKLEQQVCSLGLAKRLKELGVKQDGMFLWSWAIPSRGKTPQERLALDNQTEPGIYRSDTDWGDCFDSASAFTVAELGEILPFRKEENGIIVYVTTHKNMDKWGWTVKAMKHDVRNPEKENQHFAVEQADTEADARAKMLIYLLENKLIKL